MSKHKALADGLWHQGSNAALLDIRLSPAEKLVFAAMAHRKDKYFWAFPSQRRIACATDLDLATVKRSIRKLAELGYLVEAKTHPVARGGRTRVYEVVYFQPSEVPQNDWEEWKKAHPARGKKPADALKSTPRAKQIAPDKADADGGTMHPSNTSDDDAQSEKLLGKFHPTTGASCTQQNTPLGASGTPNYTELESLTRTSLCDEGAKVASLPIQEEDLTLDMPDGFDEPEAPAEPPIEQPRQGTVRPRKSEAREWGYGPAAARRQEPWATVQGRLEADKAERQARRARYARISDAVLMRALETLSSAEQGVCAQAAQLDAAALGNILEGRAKASPAVRADLYSMALVFGAPDEVPA